MAMIAHKCENVQVTVVDLNVNRIAQWNSPMLPVYEPGLQMIVERNRGKNLFFSSDVEKHIAASDIIFVSVNTPTKTYGVGAGSAADTRYVELVARSIAQNMGNEFKIIVEKSTVPIKTAAMIEEVIRSSGRTNFEVLSNPEFLAEGTAIRDLENPDRVLIGSKKTERGIFAANVLVDIYARWVDRSKILTTNTWSSELSKLVANAFLAQRISSINAVSVLCDSTGADVTEVSKAIGADSRIGPKFLQASVGFGGSCFKKDVLNLTYICECEGLNEVANYFRSIVEMNEYQKKRFAQTVVRKLFGSVAGKRIAVLGFAFKKDTNDTRESPAIDVCNYLIEEQAVLSIYDPKVPAVEIRSLCCSRVNVDDSPYMAALGADAVIILTEWDEFKALDFHEMAKVMRHPAHVIDGRNILDRSAVEAAGLSYQGVGQ